MLDKYIAAATKISGGGKSRRTVRRGADLAAIREWGKANGFKVSDRGRVSAELKDAYNNAKLTPAAATTKRQRPAGLPTLAWPFI